MIKFFKQIFHLIFFGNIFISICACALIYSTNVQLKRETSIYYYSLVFFATLFIYNLQRIFYKSDVSSNIQSERREWVFKNQIVIKVLALIGLLGGSIFFFFNDFKIIFYLSPLLLLSLFYFLPQIKLRKNAWLKLIVLALVWTLVTALVPFLLTNSGYIDKNYILHIAARFCFMLAICIPFDIRDVEVDRKENIFTLSVLYGEYKSKMIAIAFMLLYVLLIFLEYFLGMFELKVFVALLISAIVNTILVFMTNSKRNEYFYTAVLDGTMLVHGGLLVIAQML